MKCKTGYKKSGDKCVKTSRKSSSRKNKINFDALWIFVTIFGIIVLAGIFFYGGSKGWFKSLTIVDDAELITLLNMPETASSCSLSISPNSIWAGDRTTGTIVDGKNKLCHVYVYQGGSWLSAYQGYTDSNGVLINTRTMNFPGNFIFRAVCDINEDNRVDTGDCLTNKASLTVIPRSDDPSLLGTCQDVCSSEGYADGWNSLFEDGHDCSMSGSTFIEYGIPGEEPLFRCCCDNLPDDEGDPAPACTDSDGGQDRYTPGHVTTDSGSAYDVCEYDNLGVIEYYCDDLLGLQGASLPCDIGQSCISTRSGGYCGEAGTGGWSPGDEVFAESGESGISGGVVTATGYIDLSDYGFIPGGTCSLKVRLHTYWDYQDEDACSELRDGHVRRQALNWQFYDSDGLAWSRSDYTPENIYDVIYPPLHWDGVNPWVLKVGMVYQINGCSIQYYYDINIDIHECG